MDIIISSILNIVSNLCSCSANNKCCYLFDLQENKEDLSSALVELRAIRDDVKIGVDEAENNPNELMKRTHEVDSWLQRVEAIEGEVVQVIEKADQEIQGRCIGGYCPKNCWSVHKIGKLVIRKVAFVNNIRSKGNFGDVAYKLPPPLVHEEPVDVTVGMESMFDKVLKSLAEDKVGIMGLYGQGGVGKTTLLKQINNEFLKRTTIPHDFVVVILVVVSKPLDIDAIQNEIGHRLGLRLPNKTNICAALTKQKFLLLLDDIWERVDLQSIGIPRYPRNNSKVIFTTRSEIVCGDMEANMKFKVECLPWGAAWTLFQEKLGNAFLKSRSELVELAEVVAKKCGGLPLALITIGRAMSTKNTIQQWKHAITTLKLSTSKLPGMGDKVLPLLKLSYDDLEDETTKSCFRYCALYPEAHSIYIPKLIDYWIGEGILNEIDHVDNARHKGYDVIGILKAACLLESGVDGKTQVKMHDVIRDLALWIACECGVIESVKMLNIGALDCRSEESWHTAERIYLRPPGRDEKVAPPNSPNLLTLIYDLSCGKFSIPNSFFELMPLLRVLDLSHSRMETFPISITKLLELRYLSLSMTHIQVLPEELQNLVELKFLDLSEMTRLKIIPSGVIGSLSELRVLNLYRCSGKWNFDEVYNLKHLNDLRITINSQLNLERLLSNQNLQMCTRGLHLDESNNSRTSSNKTLGVDSLKSLGKLELLSNLETLSVQSLPMNME